MTNLSIALDCLITKQEKIENTLASFHHLTTKLSTGNSVTLCWLSPRHRHQQSSRNTVEE